MISKTISSAALGMLTGLGATTNQPVVNNNITINSGSQESKDSTFIEPNPYAQTEDYSVSPQFTMVFNKMCISLLTVNDYKLLGNIIDQSHRIICSVQDLQILISLFLGCQQSDVSVNLYPVEPIGCCGCRALNPFCDIENIKIKSKDFKLMYNTAYNVLKDDYHICFDRVLI